MKLKNSFWIILGKVSLLLTVLWGIIELYQYFGKNDYQIKALCKISPFILPAPVLDSLNSHASELILNSIYSKSFNDGKHINSVNDIELIKKPLNQNIVLLNDTLKLYKDSIIKLEKIKSVKIVPLIKDLHFKTISINRETSKLEEEIYNLDRVKSDFDFMTKLRPLVSNVYSEFWELSILNAGDMPLEEMVLEVPAYGEYSLIVKNEQVRNGSFSEKINIGYMSPISEVNLKIWTKKDTTFFVSRKKTEARIVHKNGWAKIKFEDQVSGFMSYIKENSLILALNLFMYLCFLFTILQTYWLVTKYYQRRKKI